MKEHTAYLDVQHLTACEKYIYHKRMAEKLELILIDLKNHGYSNKNRIYHRLYSKHRNHVLKRAMYHDKALYLMGVITNAESR